MLIALQLWMFHHGCDLDPKFDFVNNNIVGLLIEQHFFTKDCIQNIWTLDNNITLLAQIVEENESISSISEKVVHMLSDAIHSRDQIQRVVDNISPTIDDNFTITQDLRTRILDAQRDIVHLQAMFSDSQSQMLLYLETIPIFYLEKFETCEAAKSIRYINDNIKKFNNISDWAKHFRLKSRSSTSGVQKDITNSDVASNAEVHSPEETNETLAVMKYQVILQLSVVHKGVSTVKKREVRARCLTCHEKEADYMECYINGTPNNNPVDKYPFLSAVYAFPVNDQFKSTGESVRSGRLPGSSPVCKSGEVRLGRTVDVNKLMGYEQHYDYIARYICDNRNYLFSLLSVQKLHTMQGKEIIFDGVAEYIFDLIIFQIMSAHLFINLTPITTKSSDCR